MPGTNFPNAKAAVIFRPSETIAAAFLAVNKQDYPGGIQRQPNPGAT